jgi:hypothetical protein
MPAPANLGRFCPAPSCWMGLVGLHGSIISRKRTRHVGRRYAFNSALLAVRW